eukprot:6488318-Amphidinium_carterae.1
MAQGTGRTSNETLAIVLRDSLSVMSSFAIDNGPVRVKIASRTRQSLSSSARDNVLLGLGLLFQQFCAEDNISST